jgi:pyrophosphatase PpaX
LREFARDVGLADPDAAADEMLATYRAHNDEHHDALIKEFAGVPAMLDALQRAHHRLGVVTSKREGAARRGLDRYDLARYFEVAVFHDDTERHKPDPEPLLAAASQMGVSLSDVVYVGDSVHDVVAGRAAGVRTIAALWGPFDRADLERVGPDDVAETPRDVLRLLGVDD